MPYREERETRRLGSCLVSLFAQIFTCSASDKKPSRLIGPARSFRRPPRIFYTLRMKFFDCCGILFMLFGTIHTL